MRIGKKIETPVQAPVRRQERVKREKEKAIPVENWPVRKEQEAEKEKVDVTAH
jgi:hypothetical protein